MLTSEMLQHIIQPSQKIDDKFAAWIAVTSDGRVLNGLMESETADNVVLKLADRQKLTIARSDIEELRKSTSSLMPDSVLADLTAEEAADLLAFIQSLTARPTN